MGDKYVCIKNNIGDAIMHLEIGKVYYTASYTDVISYEQGLILILVDGHRRYYPLNFFQHISKFRNDVIDEILDDFLDCV